jgi:hypothetical protein
MKVSLEGQHEMMVNVDKIFKDRRKVSRVFPTDVNDVTFLSAKHTTFSK